jgi:hypothetical protein
MLEAEDHPEIREAVQKLCAQFPGGYWRKLDATREPLPACIGGAGEGSLVWTQGASARVPMEAKVSHS